jgi:hypothetical protein
MQNEPALVVRLQGLDYAYVYDLNQIAPPHYLFTGEEAEVETNPLPDEE